MYVHFKKTNLSKKGLKYYDISVMSISKKYIMFQMSEKKYIKYTLSDTLVNAFLLFNKCLQTKNKKVNKMDAWIIR